MPQPTACSMQSPLKRRCIDMDEDDDDLPLLDQNLATPIFKSEFATKLYQESRRQKFEQQAQKESEQQKQPQQQHQDKEQLQPQSQQQHAPSPAKQATESKKVPLLFLQMVPEIMPLLEKLHNNAAVGKFNTKATTGSGLRIQCEDMATYHAIQAVLAEDGIHLHTHQLRSKKGFRAILRYLHHSTPCEWLKTELNQLGFMARSVRLIKHRFTGKPLNLFEIELEPQEDRSHESILNLKELNSQAVVVERQAKPRDPVQLNANRVNPKDHQQHPASQHRQQPQTDNRRRQQSQLPRQLAADNPHSAPDYNENLSYSQVVRGVKNVAPICNLQSTTPSAITPKYAENSEKSSYSRVVRGNGIPAARPRNPAQKHLNKLQQQLRQRQQQRPAAKKSSATPSKQTAEIRAASSNTYNQVMSGDISTDRVRNPAERHLAKLQQQLRDEQQQLHVHAGANVRRFQDLLDQKIHLNTEIHSDMDIEDAVDIFIRNINEAAAATTHSQHRKQNGPRSHHGHNLELDEPTRRLLREKQQSKQFLLATRTSEARRQYRAAQNRRQYLKPHQNRMLLSTYADDTVIMCASDLPSTAIRENQAYLGHFAEWAKKWSIGINASKTGHVLYTLRNLDEAIRQRSPLLNGQQVPCKTVQTYLGVKLDRKLTLQSHVTKLRIKLRARARKLEWLLVRASLLGGSHIRHSD
ncbi:hypothetical protein ACLKA6_000566 [Drosophila palustris]